MYGIIRRFRLIFLGQICPLYTGLWFLLSLPIVGATHYLNRSLFSPKKRNECYRGPICWRLDFLFENPDAFFKQKPV